MRPIERRRTPLRTAAFVGKTSTLLLAGILAWGTVGCAAQNGASESGATDQAESSVNTFEVAT